MERPEPEGLSCGGCQGAQSKLYCFSCQSHFCHGCWTKQHPPENPWAAKHEKIDSDVYQRLEGTFNPPSDAKIQDKLHRDDEETTWFAVKRDANGHPKILHDSGRYASLVAHGSCGGEHLARFPALVSFVGQTGAGKSTLIKMLIERRLASRIGGGSIDRASARELFATPVVGSYENDIDPTSGDVHLYADPSSYFEERPIFYVDSEGLEAGEKNPIAMRWRDSSQNERPTPGGKPPKSGRTRSRLTKKWRFSREVSRNLNWGDGSEHKKREFAVTHLYPRILYTFSDVIVFVLRNSRTFESAVVTRLIDWAVEVLNASTNQPRLPHAIIAVNAAISKTPVQRWDVEDATNRLLGSVNESTPSERATERIRALMKHWDLPEKPVRSVRDLLLCYYSSVRVVFIPDDNQYLRLEAQTEKLHGEIQSACESSMMSKKKARMLMNADELDELFQAAFDHFSRSPDATFDLIKAARKNTPIPRDFAGNLTKIAVAIRDTLQKERNITGHDVFKPLSLMAASSILLECTRSNWKGSALEFFEANYSEPCLNALQDFCKQFWPCEYADIGTRGKGRCVNTLARHQKGHQMKGKQVPGEYVASFTFDGLLPLWLNWIRDWLDRFQSYLLQHPRTREEDMIPKIHRHNLHRFFEQVGGSFAYVNHSVCMCCVRELPEHPLQCGHVLCTLCMKAYGVLDDRLKAKGAIAVQPGHISLHRCPLHSTQRAGFEFVEPRTISLKPDWAGVRLLCLDGGGIRGIVELEVLRHIEMELGGLVPIQSFFDLIVGTSTGGIIATGLGIKNWRVTNCITKFMTLADKAFTKRLLPGLHDIPIIGKAGRRYHTKPFEEVLQHTFKDDSLFGGYYIDPSNYRTRVALTSTTATGSTPVVLANYNRPDESPFTDFLRPDHPEDELKIWEAIRATTAAPGYFKPFTKPETGQRFVDGAVYHNNPIYVAFEESKLLWPDVRHRLPDIILSIGTGHNRQKNDAIRLDMDTEYSLKISRTAPPDVNGAENDLSRVFQNFRMMFARMSNVLSSHIRWVSFEREVTLPVPLEKTKDARSRLQRIDPPLGYDPPSLDDKAKMIDLKRTVNEVLTKNPRQRRQIRYVARRLIASSFYFEKLRHDGIGSGHYQCDGRILCRFPNNSDELSHLGNFLRSQQCQGSNENGQRDYPMFCIEEQGRPRFDMEISSSVVDKMCQGQLSIFDFDRVVFRVSNKNAEVTLSLALWDTEEGKADVIPVSGFPRRIVAESSQPMPASPSFGTVEISAADYWKEVDEYTSSYRELIQVDDLDLNNATSSVEVPKSRAWGLWQDAGPSWEFRRLLRRRPRMTVSSGNKKPPSHSPSQTPSLSSASNEESDDQLGTPIKELQLNEPGLSMRFSRDEATNRAPESALETEEDEDEPLSLLIRRNLGVLRGLGANGTSIVEMERAVALSLLEGRAVTPHGLGFDPDDFDEEQDEGD
ncbi:hypothetical protein B0T10DRAFT_490889 [Thelonectria olida]|uniref:PNPLA domain-containing protein n=1 Tax=Thelonectria olida TaxID=1576542 RepID=A0A9P8W2J4_9HYPO|nr:hypothetical protein B0T10DRAFT_490889 [Thelonectria olida]